MAKKALYLLLFLGTASGCAHVELVGREPSYPLSEDCIPELIQLNLCMEAKI